MDRKKHWENTYTARRSEELSWYQERPEISLEMIQHSGISLDDPIIDVGGGASILADCLLKEGFSDITVLDVSATALRRGRRRLGADASRITWIEQDITRFAAERAYALWHDRAMFHFLTREQDRKAYAQSLRMALRPAGQALISTFALGGPVKCSGLDIVQYDAESLLKELGPDFSLVEQREENHRTPAGHSQHFGYFRLRFG
jgi:2-polyprenyl-3-methyl-5-hydroxy-6-metoxy-1,4-benzoquinol methylase